MKNKQYFGLPPKKKKHRIRNIIIALILLAALYLFVASVMVGSNLKISVVSVAVNRTDRDNIYLSINLMFTDNRPLPLPTILTPVFEGSYDIMACADNGKIKIGAGNIQPIKVIAGGENIVTTSAVIEKSKIRGFGSTTKTTLEGSLNSKFINLIPLPAKTFTIDVLLPNEVWP